MGNLSRHRESILNQFRGPYRRARKKITASTYFYRTFYYFSIQALDAPLFAHRWPLVTPQAGLLGKHVPEEEDPESLPSAEVFLEGLRIHEDKAEQFLNLPEDQQRE